MTEIHQFIPTFAPHSAVSDHTVQVHWALREMGIESQIYAAEVNRGVAVKARPYREFERRPRSNSTWLLYQASTGSSMAHWLLTRPEGKVVDYHNVTPAASMGPWEPHLVAEFDAGRRQLGMLAPVTELGLADSGFNAQEMIELGYRKTAVLPILLDTAAFAGAVDRPTLDRLGPRGSSPGATWLFVGRVAPHKAQHDIIKAFAAYRRAYDPDARLHLVGGSSSYRYSLALEGYVAVLGLRDAVEITGTIPEPARNAYYRAADVFVCLSDHEGFCVPLLESWHHDVPVVAFSSTAVPETLGDGGVLLDDKNPALVAAAVHRVLTDPPLRDRLVANGHARLAEFALDRSKAKLESAVKELLAGPA